MLCRTVHRRGENNVRRLQARHLKVFGKHTDDSHRMIVKLDGLVQNIWVTGEAAHPKSIRNECNFWAVGQILFREELRPSSGEIPKVGRKVCATRAHCKGTGLASVRLHAFTPRSKVMEEKGFWLSRHS